MPYIKSRPARKKPLHHLATPGAQLSTALLAGLMTTTSYAATTTTASSDSIALPEVSVSGSVEADQSSYHRDQLSSGKFTEPTSRTPQTIQIIDSQIISNQHATTLTEALRNSPGVGTFFVGENGNSQTGDSVFMRGVDSSGSILVDGVRDISAISRDTFNTEQVEVIKGSNGTNYGRSSAGGSINMVTKQARWGNQVSGDISAGTDHQRRTTLDVNRQISDTTAVRLNIIGEDSDIAGRDWAEDKRWGIAPAITFGLGTDKRLKLNYLHITQNNRPDGGAATVGLPGYSSPDPTKPGLDNLPKPKSTNFYGTKNDFEDVTRDSFAVIYEQDFDNDKSFHNITRWSRTEQQYQISALFARKIDPTTFETRRLPNFKDQTITTLTNQSGIVQHATTGSAEHTLSYGLELSREQLKSNDIRTPLVPDGSGGFVGENYFTNIYHPNHYDPTYRGVKSGASAKGTVDTAAVYLFDTIQLDDHWQLNGGVRLDHYKLDYKNSVATCGVRGTPACTAGYTTDTDIDTTVSDNLFSWQAGVLYQINEQGNVYANYAVSSQPPGSTNLELSSRDSRSSNAKYDPEEAKTAEIGTKWSLANNRLLLTAAAYSTKIDNQVTQDAVGSGNYIQDGEKRVRGIELSALGQITDNWNITAGFTTMDAKITSGTPEANNGSDTSPYSPKRAFTSWTTYKLPMGLTIGGGARYNGELTRGSDGAKGTPDKTESYWVVDTMASYDLTDNLGLQLNVYNVFNKDFVAAINKSGYRYTPGTPRTAILSMNYSF